MAPYFDMLLIPTNPIIIFITKRGGNVVARGGHGGYRDEKPAKCDVVPQSACALAYDSSKCDGELTLMFKFCKSNVAASLRN